MPENMTDEMLARGIKAMLVEGMFSKIDFELLPASLYRSLASSVRDTDDNGELHGAISQRIIKASMIEAILDAEYPDEVEPL